jgi:hypothetical protein
MEMTDKDRYQKIREDLGPFCGIVELSRVKKAKRSAGLANTALLARSRSTPTAPANWSMRSAAT